MVMWDMLWYPVNVISSVKSAPSWRLSRLINRLSIMLGSPLSTASMKNCTFPYTMYGECTQIYRVGHYNNTYWPWGERGRANNMKRIGCYPQETCWTLTECCAHFTEWTCGTRQVTVSEGVWRDSSTRYCDRPCLQWGIKWSDGPTEPGVTSCLSCVVTVVWSEWWLITAHWCQLVSTIKNFQSTITLSTQSGGVSVVNEVDYQYKVTTYQVL